MNYLQLNKQAYEFAAKDYEKMLTKRTSEYNEMYNFLERYFPRIDKKAHVLELGPGNGYFSKFLSKKGFKVTGIEFSTKMAEVAKRTSPKLEIIVDDFLQHNFAKSKYDLIVAIQFLHLFKENDLKKVLRKIKSHLNPHGLAFFTTTLHTKEQKGLLGKKSFKGKPIRYRRKFTPDSFKSVVLNSGLKILEYSEIYRGVKTIDNSPGYIRIVVKA